MIFIIHSTRHGCYKLRLYIQLQDLYFLNTLQRIVGSDNGTTLEVLHTINGHDFV